MQQKHIWILLILFSISLISISFIGCGSDEDTKDTETPIDATSTDPTDEPVIASSTPIDYDTEKQAIQEVFSRFYRAFNNKDMQEIIQTWDTSTSAEFAVVWVAGGFNEQVGPIEGWSNIKSKIEEGLWTGVGTAGQKWGPTDRLSQFWIRKRKSNSRELEASARGAMCFKPGGPGTTLVYLIKKSDQWMIQGIDSMTQPALASRSEQGIPKALIGNYFTDPDAKVN